ncbi:SsgA family sporulation/cell division regulator [Streptomyces zhihengii]
MTTFSDGVLPDRRWVARRVMAHQVREGRRIPVSTTLRYDTRDPYAIEFTFHVARGMDVVWYVDRGMLHAGVDAPAGTGTSGSPGARRPRPAEPRTGRAPGADHDGTRPAGATAQETYALVDLGGESAHLDWSPVTDALAS